MEGHIENKLEIRESKISTVTYHTCEHVHEPRLWQNMRPTVKRQPKDALAANVMNQVCYITRTSNTTNTL